MNPMRVWEIPYNRNGCDSRSSGWTETRPFGNKRASLEGTLLISICLLGTSQEVELIRWRALVIFEPVQYVRYGSGTMLPSGLEERNSFVCFLALDDYAHREGFSPAQRSSCGDRWRTA